LAFVLVFFFLTKCTVCTKNSKEAEYTTTTTTTKSVVVLDEEIIKEEKDTYTLHSRSKYEKDEERWAAACS
jgi:hypothetical protein